ncbi:MAG: ABC transporter permease [Vicinamibacterales bacterium]
MFQLLRRLRARLKYRHFDRDLAQELESHRAMKQDELEASGVGSADARSTAARALGNVTYMREESRGVWIGRWVETMWQDVRYGMATLRRQPMFGIGTVVMLGLGLGLVTTVFTVADATFFRPWRVPNPETLFYVRSTAAPGSDFAGASVPEYRYLREHSRTFRQLAVTVRDARVRLFFDAEAYESVQSMMVSANYFDLLGARIIAGRSFLPGEDNTTAPSNVIVISERIWKERFARDPNAIGRTVRIGRTPVTIVGVVSASFLDGHNSRTEVWRAISLAEYQDPRHRDFPHATLGRLTEGVTQAEAIAEMGQLSAAFRAGHQLPAISFHLVDTRPRTGNGEALQVVGLVFVALVLVQLVACANVGNLLLARAIVRQREIAVRLSLGAGRWRVVRQLVTETTMLALCAGALGVGIAIAIPSVVTTLYPNSFEAAAFYAPTATTFGFVFGMSLLTALACSLTPALRATRVSMSTLAGERHGQTAASARLRRALLAMQIALAMLLLSAAGLLTRAIDRASGADPGFAIGEFQEVAVQFPPGSQGPRRKTLYEQLFAATRTPDWPPIALNQEAPVADDHFGMPLRTAPTAPVRFVARRGVTPNHFDVLGIPLVAGRTFDDRDDRELVVSRAVAELFWPGENPLGKTLFSGVRSSELQSHLVVGVVPDLPIRTLAKTDPVAYTMSQYFVDRALIRSLDPAVVERLRSVVQRIDPDVTISARPLKEILVDALFIARIGSRVAWGIGIIGLLLATIGAFSLFTQAVEERRREIGIRMALGAQATQVVALVLQTTRRSIVSGLVIGLGLAALAAQLLRSYLYGLSPFDPVAYLQIAAILLFASLVATWIPARRATRVNPVDTLRAE